MSQVTIMVRTIVRFEKHQNHTEVWIPAIELWSGLDPSDRLMEWFGFLQYNYGVVWIPPIELWSGLDPSNSIME